MNLEQHAKTELDIAGLLDPNSDYDGMVGEAVMELVDVFAKQGHSGFSAAYTLDVFLRVAQYKTLTPIGSDPSEWFNVSEASGGRPMWQNKRCSSCFSEDGGKTWYDIDAKPKFREKVRRFVRRLTFRK